MTMTENTDPVDLQEEENPDEQIWNDFAGQVSAPPESESVEEPEPAEAAEETSPEPEPEPPAEAELAAPEPEEETPPAEPETPPVEEPPAAPEPAPQLAPSPPEETPLTDEQRRERIADLRKAALVEAERVFALNEETEQEYLQSPGKVLPRLAAQVQMAAQETVIQEVMRMLPMAVSMEIERRNGTEAFWGEFEQEWPKLSGRRPELERMAATYQAMNPGTSRADLIRNVGASAMVALRIPVESAAPAPADPPPPPPHRPVTSAAPAAPAPKMNQFEAYSMELEEDPDS